MPEIIVRANATDRQESVVLLRERVNVADFESRHFTTQLIERLDWAGGDADAAEQARRAEDRVEKERHDPAQGSNLAPPCPRVRRPPGQAPRRRPARWSEVRAVGR